MAVKNTQGPQNKPDTIEISLPENLSNYITPIMILIGTIVISVTIIMVGNKITSKLSSNSGSDDTGNTTATEVTLDDIKALFDEDVISFGKANSDLIFVEISDPSCPYCHIAGGYNSALNIQIDESYKESWVESNPDGDPNTTEAKAQWQVFTLAADGGTYVAPVDEMHKLVESGDASFIYLYANGHGNGELAAEALYCAYEEDKFWEAHELLLSGDGYTLLNTTGPTIDNISTFLSSVVDEDTMKDCLDSGKYSETVAGNEDLAANMMGGTPTFWVNDKQFIGAYSWTDMESYL